MRKNVKKVTEKFGTFFRIEVRDAAGNQAYSNAYYADSP